MFSDDQQLNHQKVRKHVLAPSKGLKRKGICSSGESVAKKGKTTKSQ